jgi:hypothetical protein
MNIFGNYILYNSEELGKEYKLYFNYQTKQVRINDGCYEFDLNFTEEMLISELIKEFEDLVSDKDSSNVFLDSLIEHSEE